MFNKKTYLFYKFFSSDNNIFFGMEYSLTTKSLKRKKQTGIKFLSTEKLKGHVQIKFIIS